MSAASHRVRTRQGQEALEGAQCAEVRLAHTDVPDRGVDLTRIDGIDVTKDLVVMSEVGSDMSKFPDDKHFASWLGLCPGAKITCGKVMSCKTAHVTNRAAQAFKRAAAALRTSLPVDCGSVDAPCTDLDLRCLNWLG